MRASLPTKKLNCRSSDPAAFPVERRCFAVAGQDDLEDASAPFLTTTTSPYEKLAALCARRVCDLLTGEAAESSVYESISSHLIIRESTGSFRGKERK